MKFLFMAFCISVLIFFGTYATASADQPDAAALAAPVKLLEDYLGHLRITEAPDLSKVRKDAEEVKASASKVVADSTTNEATKKEAIKLIVQAYLYATWADATAFFADLKSEVANAVKAYPGSDLAAWAECIQLAEELDPVPSKFLDQVRAFQKKYPTAEDAIWVVYRYAERLRVRSSTADAINLLKEALKLYSNNKFLNSDLKALEAIGKPAVLTGPTLDGAKFDLADFAGKDKVVLVYFWASWCGPCRGNTQTILDMYSDLHSKGLEIVGVSSDKTKKDASQYVQDHGIAWPQIFHDKAALRQKLAAEWGVGGFPSYFVIDKKGNLTDLPRQHDVDAARKLVETELAK